MNKIKLSDLATIAEIFGGSGMDYYIFDPTCLVEENFQNKLIIRDLALIKSAIDKAENFPVTLFNFSADELLDLYCSEKVGAILKFQQQAVSSFNPFATYHYLTDRNGVLKTILSPGSRKINLAIDKSEGLSSRFQNGIKSQGIRLGFQKYFSDGSFTFYYKEEHPVEKLLTQYSYDSYTLEFAKTAEKLTVTVQSWKDGELLESVSIDLNSVKSSQLII